MAPHGVKPVFVKSRDLPPSEDTPFTTREICGEIEDSLGHGTMDGAQQIGGLWRLYPKTEEARRTLLVGGMSLRKVQCKLHDLNPFLVRSQGPGSFSDQVETTKLTISDIPMSFSNKEIENALLSAKCKLVSKLVDECDRDEHGKLTRWKTGRRFIYIAVPTSPLPNSLKIGIFTAKLYHREQRMFRQSTCGNCLQPGHRRYDCVSEIVCRICRTAGHKAGDRLCDGGEATPGGQPETQVRADESTTSNSGDSENNFSGDEIVDSENEDISADKKGADKKGEKRKAAESANTSRCETPRHHKSANLQSTPDCVAALITQVRNEQADPDS